MHDTRQQIAANQGFASWEKLVAYQQTWQLHERTGPRYSWDGPERFTNRVASMSIELANRKKFAVQPPDIQGTGAFVATYVPRFFGLTNEEIFAADITDAELQLVVARNERFASWDELMAFASTHIRGRNESPAREARRQATQALQENNRLEATRVFQEYPELLQPRDSRGERESILNDVVLRAIREPKNVDLENYAFVRSLGVDFASTLNERLLGSPRTTTEEIQTLLNTGADPEWSPGNGYSVLEHAVYRYWNGDAVDLIAERVVPRKSFWLSAALGDVDTMLQFIDNDGVPTDEARRDRPPFEALGMSAPNRPDAGDRDIVWEAFMLACMNNRSSTIDALLAHGFPIDYAPHQMTMLNWAVGNWVPEVAEVLIERGADVTYKTWPSVSSAREMSENWIDQSPENEIAQRLFRLCAR